MGELVYICNNGREFTQSELKVLNISRTKYGCPRCWSENVKPVERFNRDYDQLDRYGKRVKDE